MPLKMDTTNVITASVRWRSAAVSETKTHKSTFTNLLTLFKQNGELKHAGLISRIDGANA